CRAVDERRTGVARRALDAREERVLEVREGGTDADPVEPRALEARAVGVPLEVEDGPRYLTAPDEGQRLHTGRLLENEDGLVRRFVRRADPRHANGARREPDAQLLSLDAVTGRDDDLR